MRTYHQAEPVTYKDMSVMREADKAKEQRLKTHFELRDYSMKHKVTVDRELNADADRDLIFRLTVDDKMVLLDSEQLMRILRWV